MKLKLAKTLMPAALALGLSAIAGAAFADDSQEPYRVHVCNNSGKNVVVAATYQAVGDNNAWTHQGWWKMAPGVCVYVFNTGNPSFALRAESLDDSTYLGTAGFQQCFQTAGPYAFTTALSDLTCPAPSTSRPAIQFAATQRGAYTWSIPPGGWQAWSPPSN
jgi:hypothetical protein